MKRLVEDRRERAENKELVSDKNRNKDVSALETIIQYLMVKSNLNSVSQIITALKHFSPSLTVVCLYFDYDTNKLNKLRLLF